LFIWPIPVEIDFLNPIIKVSNVTHNPIVHAACDFEINDQYGGQQDNAPQKLL